MTELRKNEATIEQALEILGQKRVVTAAQKSTLWRADIGPLPGVGYTVAELRESAILNRLGGNDWRLAYVLGRSFRQQYEEIGHCRDHQPCFDPDAKWWLDGKEDQWAAVNLTAGYALVDCCGRWGQTRWHDQEKKIEALGNVPFGRVPESWLAEIVFDTFRLNDGERLLPDWYHWGLGLASVGARLLVGYFGGLGLRVDAGPPEWSDYGYRRVCLLRKSTLALEP